MNKIKLFTVLALSTANLTWAQRSVNMEAVLEGPLDGNVWQNGAEVPVTLKLINHGPDNLVMGDTLFLTPNVSGFGIQAVILEATLLMAFQ